MKNYILAIILFVLTSASLFAQTYNIATENGNTITTCSGTVYDSGGSTGDYGSSEDYTVTFCPSTAGAKIQIQLTFDIETDYDWLEVYYGSVDQGYIDSSGTITLLSDATDGCITLNFISDGSINYSGFSGIISCIVPGVPNTQDCLGAIPVCNGAYSNPNSYAGTGNINDEIDGTISCMASGEKNDVWYVFTAQNTDNIGFSITPNNATDDYDWAVFDLTNATCDDVYNDASIEISCNWSATDGTTGASSSGNGSSQDASGTVWNDLIPVIAGGTYVINISNFSSTQYGYDIDFTSSGSTTTMVDQSAPLLDQITSSPACGESEITFDFTERVLCSSVSASDFTVTGPGGTYSITNIDCNSGATYSQSFTITLNTPLTAGGTYSLNLTGQVDDACGNTVNGNSLSFTVTGVTGTATITHNVDCYGGNNGTATVSGSGGTSPYTYHWSTGSSSTSVSGLSATSYTVTITDNGGVCQDIQSVTITQPSPISVSFNTTDVQCNGGSDGIATAIPTGGNGATWTYNWSAGGATSSATNTGLSHGTTYTVTVHDNKNCAQTSTITVSEPTALAITGISQQEPNCHGDNNGQLSVTNPHGGTPNYTYNWSAGGATSSQTNTSLTTGTYSVTVEDAHHCQLIQTNIALGEPAAITNTNTITNVSCNGDANGSIATSASGGTGTLTYFWSPSGQASSTATGLTAGNYNVTITDANSCTLTQSNITVNQPNALSIDATTFTAPSCNAGSNGTATVTTVSGGTPNYTYHWSNGQNTQTATGLSASTYSVTVTDHNGCSKVTSITLTQPTNVTSGVSFTQPNCNGESNGTATVTGGGGTPNYTYLWDSNAGNVTTATASGLSAGTYNVTVYDSNNCPKTNSVTITQPTAIAIDGITPVEPNCYGDNNGQLAINNPNGGTPTYTYSWSPSGETSQTATGLAAGTYAVTVQDNHGCQFIQTGINLAQPTAISNTNSITDATCNGSSTGSIATNATGGTSTLSYQWSANTGGQATATASNLDAGNYDVTISDTHGCELVNSNITINEDPAIVINVVSTTDASCGNSDGSATVSATGGTNTGYTYAWEGGQTGATISGVPAGSYDVTVTDNTHSTCEQVLNVSINDALAPTISINSHTDLNCNDDNSGTASVIGSGGTGTLIYSWSNNAGNVTSVSGLSAGTYTASVTDGNGCVASIPINISEPTALNAIISSSSNPTCYGYSDGDASVSASGGTSSGTYNYSWNTSPTQTTQTASSLPEGTYTVIVTDDNGCTISKDITLTQPSAVSIDATSFVEPLCHNGTNGSATVNAVSGGTSASGNYSYNWNTSPTQNGQTASNLVDGTYNVTVSDDNACTATTSVIVTEPTQVTSTVSFVEPLCNSISNGTATITGHNGTPSYTYLWDANAGSQTTATASNLSAGIAYSVTLTDNNGCTTTNNVTLTEPDALTISGINSIMPNCYGESNGQLQVLNPQGGTPNYTYTWSPSGSGQNASGLSAGTYSVTVKDDNNCTLTQTGIVLSQPTAIINSNTITNTTCNGNSTGSIVTNASGGTGSLSYAWNPNGETTSSITNIPAGNYSVTITDDNGCELASNNISVAEPTALNIDGTSFVEPLCFTDNNGTATVNVSGGTVASTYNYLWNTSPAQIGQTAINLTAGNYSVTVSDDNNCQISTTITVTQPSLVSVGITASNPVCNGDNNGSAIANGSGGTISSDYSYIWDDGLGQTTQTASNLVIGTYNVTITDENGCTATDDVTLTEPTELLSSIVYDNVKCFGNSDGYAIVTANDGSPTYNYQWDSNAGNATTDSVGGLQIGTYYVTITDSHNCTKIDSATIIQPQPLTVTPTSVDVLCHGGNDGQGNIVVNGGTNPYTFNWSNGSANQNITDEIGTYTVTVTDNNNCIETASLTIDQPDTMDVTSIIVNPNCGNADGSVVVTATGGIGSYTYLWDVNAGSGTTNTANNLVAGSYIVSVTDGNSCLFALSSSLSDFGSAIIEISDSMSVKCYGDTNGFAQVGIVSGGTAPFHYNWFENGNPITYADTNLLQNIGAGNYSINVVDANNCSSSSNFILTENPPIAGPLHIDEFVSCSGFNDGVLSAVPTGGSGNYTYEWSHDTTLTDSTAINLGAGYYEVIIRDDSLCEYTMSININNPNPININLTDSTDVTCNGGSNGSITVTPNGGTANLGYNYLWDLNASNQTTATATNLNAGSYIITVSDDNGCFSSDTFSISEPLPIVLFDTTTNSICGGSTGSIEVTPIGGTAPYHYTWIDNALLDTNYRENLSGGNYYVSVVDDNGCEAELDTITVIDNGAGTYNLISTTDANCFGESSGEIAVGITGGTSPFTYVVHINGLLVDSIISPNSTDTISNLSEGTYSIVIYDQYGCVTQPGSAVVAQPNELITTDSLINVSCYNGNNGSIILTTQGGTPNYTYNWDNANSTSTIIGLTEGSYSVTVLDNHLCEENHTYTIEQPSEANTISFTNTINVGCYGDSTGSVSVVMNDGTAPYTYTGDLNESTTNLSEGTYYVTVTDANNCIANDSILITQPSAAIELSISQTTNASCYNDSTGSISINATGGTPEYNYIWSNGDTIADIKNIPSGTYTLTLTDANNCSDTISSVILNPTELLLSDSVKEEDYAGFISLYPTGGTQPYNYTWSNDVSTSTNEFLSSGDYYVTITDANGCTILNSYTIEIPLIVPTVITPNGDGKNDYFNITNIETVENVKIKIFNRWGDLIFTFNDAGEKYKEQDSQWDGTDINGDVLPLGSYVYIIEIDGELEPYKGTVTIIK